MTWMTTRKMMALMKPSKHAVGWFADFAPGSTATATYVTTVVFSHSISFVSNGIKTIILYFYCFYILGMFLNVF